jgi:hypothetical protein
LRGIDITPRFVNASIIAIRRQLINGDVKLTHVPCSPSLSEQSSSGIWPLFTISSNVLGDTQV